MNTATKRALVVFVGFGAVVVVTVGIARLASPYFENQQNECVAQCKAQGLTGTITGVQVTSPHKPGVYMTERRCLCK
jgi:hypothetical protein